MERHVAVHEAAHAVAYAHFGYKNIWVDEPDFGTDARVTAFGTGLIPDYEDKVVSVIGPEAELKVHGDYGLYLIAGEGDWQVFEGSPANDPDYQKIYAHAQQILTESWDYILEIADRIQAGEYDLTLV